MSKTLFYQPQCGIAGDMHLAALIDLGVPEELLRMELSKLRLDSEFSLTITRRQKSGIHGVHVLSLIHI